MRTFYFGAVSALLLSPLSCLAADNTTDEIVVTATRTAQTADASLASVSVITRADIERSQAGSVAELLSGEMGVDSAVNGGYGKTTSLYLRGTNSDHVLVLIDGLRVGSATSGTYPFEYLSLDEVERIEIVRGPRSSLYGSDAIGGVIQIFTRKGQEKFKAEAEAGYGTYRSGRVGAGVSGNVDGSYYSLRASRYNTQGFDAQKNGVALPAGTTPNEPDRDGYLNNTYALQLGRRFTNGADLSANLLNSTGDSEYDGAYADSTDFIQQVWGIKYAYSPLNAWRITLNIGQNRDETSNFKTQIYQSRFDTKKQLATWQNDITLGRQQLLTLGVDYLKDSIASDTPYTQTQRDNVGTYGQYQGTFGDNDLLLGLRSDDDQSFGRHSTGNLALGHALSKKLRLTASYGTAYKAPTFNDLYYSYLYGADTYILGNSNLRPEESQTTEFSLRYLFTPNLKWQANLFRTRISNLIVWPIDPPFVQTGPNTYLAIALPENIANAQVDGLETSLNARIASWDTRINYTWMDPRDTTTGTLLARRSHNTFNLQLDRNFNKLSVGTNWQIQSYRYDYDYLGNPFRLGGYGLVGLHTQYNFTPHWWLRAKVDNLFDKQYETAKTYNSPGRNLFVSVGTQWP